jgi:hypothetical protein
MADIIIISAHAGNQLPMGVKGWIKEWMTYRIRASVLVGLFGDESVDNPARDYLAEVARRAKVEFFCQPGLWPGNAAGRGTWDPAISVLTTAMQEGPEVLHWGINE